MTTPNIHACQVSALSDALSNEGHPKRMFVLYSLVTSPPDLGFTSYAEDNRKNLSFPCFF